MPSVCAFVLTYNRAELIDPCLAGIFAQTRACDHVVVLDNGSTDDSLELLRAKWSDRVTIHSLPKNRGAAGGYSAGMHLAYMTGADFIWTMDDDVVPEPEALERLFAAREFLAGEGVDAPFVISTAHTPSGAIIDPPDIHPAVGDDWPKYLHRGLLPISRTTFNSLLMPRETLAKYGLPLAQMFIWGEDTEFVRRMTRDTPGYTVGDSQVLHVREVPGKLDIRTEVHPVRIGYHRHLKRNRTFMMRRYGRKISLLRQMVREATLILQLCGRGQFDRAGIILTGVWQGLFFNPTIETVDRPFDMTGVRTFGPPRVPRTAAPDRVAVQ